MRRFHVGALLVVDAGTLVGILTDRDLVVRALAGGMAQATPVAEVMTRDPITVQGSAELADAEDLMIRVGVRRLPVLEDDEVAGLLSIDDALRDALAGLPLGVT